LDHAYKHLTPLPPLPKGKICALPGCGRKVGLPPWTIMGKPEEYCSRACTDLVFQAGKKGRNMKVPATDFGGLLTRLKCDVCGGSVLINWKSRDGKDCCSRVCQKKAEEDSMTTENETTDTTTIDPKPITAGAAAPAKKSSKKAAAKPAPKAKAAKAPKDKVAAPGKFADEDVIHIISKDHGYRDGGARHQFFALVRDGMTVAKYRKAFHEKKKSIVGHQAAGHELLVYANAGLVKIGK
jgi:hypothetical protein